MNPGFHTPPRSPRCKMICGPGALTDNESVPARVPPYPWQQAEFCLAASGDRLDRRTKARRQPWASDATRAQKLQGDWTTLGRREHEPWL